jgi:hypothetical protein
VQQDAEFDGQVDRCASYAWFPSQRAGKPCRAKRIARRSGQFTVYCHERSPRQRSDGLRSASGALGKRSSTVEADGP